MNKQCEIVRDLLPLYIDGACSHASAETVEAHISECEDCKGIYTAMKSNSFENDLQLEKEGVIARHSKAQKRKTLIAGSCIAGLLCIPIIVCLIVNLAVGHALDWFFIVLTSLAVFASLTVVPLITEGPRLLYTLLSFTAGLLLLLLSCAVYTKGDWFFVAASSVLFGLSVVFAPYIAYAAPFPAFVKRNKGLFSLTADTVLLGVLLLCIGIFGGGALYREVTPKLVLFNAGFVWAVFLICRYLRVNPLIRAGAVSIIGGGYLFSVDYVINSILGEAKPLPEFNFEVWNIDTVDGNIKWLILLCGLVIGLVCIIAGIARTANSYE